jgi:hypothetical protein
VQNTTVGLIEKVRTRGGREREERRKKEGNRRQKGRNVNLSETANYSHPLGF